MSDTEGNLDEHASTATGPADSGVADAPTRPVESQPADLKDTRDIVTAALEKASSGDDTSTEATATEASPASTGESQDADDPDAASAAAAADAKPADQGAGEGAAETDELTEQERSTLAPKVRKRIDRLLRERASLKPHAEAYRNIAAYMAENRLSAEDTARGFDFMAKVKRGDADGALQIVGPIYSQLLQLTGKELPEDIRRKVDEGYVDEETAAELARTRAAKAVADQREREDAARRQAVSTAQHTGSIRDALNSWSDAKANDPDFSAVGQHMVRLLRSEFATNPPRDARDAVKRADEMFAILRGRGAAAAAAPGAPRPTQPGPSTQHSTARPAARAPKSLEEVISMGLDRAYRRLGVA